MTQALSKPAHNEYGCTNTTRPCGAGNEAWRKGCRHPEAVAAHEAWLTVRRAERAAVLERWAITGRCHATVHGNRKAYENSGCRCAGARAAKARHDAGAKEAKRKYDRLSWGEQYTLMRRAKELTGGRLKRDPRRAWRYGKMAVGRVTVDLMTQGFKQTDATERERMVAVLRLSERIIWDQTEATSKTPSRYRKMLPSEIGERLGLAGATVKRLREKLRTSLRDGRTERRLADVKWKVAVQAAALDEPARKSREREQHLRAAADRQARKLFYLRTRRRLERSRARARFHR